MQTLFNIAHDLASAVFLVTGIFGMLFIPGYSAYWVLNSMYKRGKVLSYLPQYWRHRKEFKKWYKNKEPDVYTPKMKDDSKWN